jgi:hypothetical protein
VRWFVHGVETFEADDGDSILTADEICRYVQARIEAEAPENKPLSKGFNTNSSRGEVARRTTAAPTATALRGNREFFLAIRALDEGRLVPSWATRVRQRAAQCLPAGQRPHRDRRPGGGHASGRATSGHGRRVSAPCLRRRAGRLLKRLTAVLREQQ